MGGVVDFFAGGDDTDVASAASSPTLSNNGGLDWNLQKHISKQDSTPYAQFLAQQTQGLQPSIAQAQLKAATDQNLANQMALAASAHGPSAGTNQRLLAQNAAATGQQAAQQSGMLAAQEQQANAQNALQYQGLNNQFATHLYALGNQRDLGLMGAQVQGGLGAAQVAESGANRKRQGVADFGKLLANIGQGAASAGAGGMG